MKVKFLGHAAFLIESDGFKALIDPYLKGNPMYVSDSYDISDITHIFVTHAHGDHIGDTLEIAKSNNSLIIANAEISSIFYKKDKSLRLHPMHVGGSFTFDFGRVKMTSAVHGSGYHDGDVILDGGNPGGYVIEINNKKVYHAGDTGLLMDMKILEDEHIDLALLPIGGNYTMDYIDAAKAVGYIKPKKVVPMHYNTFPVIKTDVSKFVELVDENKVIVLKAGDDINI